VRSHKLLKLVNVFLLCQLVAVIYDKPVYFEVVLRADSSMCIEKRQSASSILYLVNKNIILEIFLRTTEDVLNKNNQITRECLPLWTQPRHTTFKIKRNKKSKSTSKYENL